MVAPLQRSLLTRITRNPYVAGECFQLSAPCKCTQDFESLPLGAVPTLGGLIFGWCVLAHSALRRRFQR